MRVDNTCFFIAFWETILLLLNFCFGLDCFPPQKLLGWWKLVSRLATAVLWCASGELAVPGNSSEGEGLRVLSPTE